MRRCDADTIAYYEQYAEAFAKRTISVDMGPIHERFLSKLPRKARILDVGCGAGRDSKIFADAGHDVTAIEPAASLAALALEHFGQQVSLHVMPLHDLPWQETFDGVWACASLLHIPTESQQWAWERLFSALVTEGVIYASYKEGAGERLHASGRAFVDQTKESLAQLVDDAKGELLEQWRTSGRLNPDIVWWNVLAQKRPDVF